MSESCPIQVLSNEECFEMVHLHGGNRAVIRAAEAAILEKLAVRLMQWRPIETAPKDGTAILAKLPDSEIPYSVRFVDGCWLITWDGQPLSWYDWPTHWIPLSQEPAIDAQVSLTLKGR